MTRPLFFLSISLILLVVPFSACKKDRICSTEKDAVIHWSGEPELDGCDWQVLIDNTPYHPENLPVNFKIEGLKVKVKYTIKEKQNDYWCSFGITLKTIDIKSISKK